MSDKSRLAPSRPNRQARRAGRSRDLSLDRANMVQKRQSTPDYGLGFQTKALRLLQVFPLRSEADGVIFTG